MYLCSGSGAASINIAETFVLRLKSEVRRAKDVIRKIVADIMKKMTRIVEEERRREVKEKKRKK